MFGTSPEIGADRSNEYLKAIAEKKDSGFFDGDLMNPHKARGELTKKFAWAIPTREALSEIVIRCNQYKVQRVVSIGAGTGYWESLIAKEWGDWRVYAYDTSPPSEEGENPYEHTAQYYPVNQGGPGKASEHRDTSALFLCWPPFDTPMAEEALEAFTGRIVIYIGEGVGGCTGNDAFFSALHENWEEVSEVDLPQWYGINDYMTIYRRKGVRPAFVI